MLGFGDRLRELRVSHGLTQQQLADKIRMRKSVISAYESSLRYPAYDVLIKLSGIFGVTTDYLLCVNDRHSIDISHLNGENKRLVISLVHALEEREK